MTGIGKIGTRQFTILVTIFTIGGSILSAPGGLAKGANQDAWIAAILGVAVSLLLVYLYAAIGKRYPKLTLAQYSEQIVGKWLGKAISLSFFSYFFLLSVLLLREIGDFVTIHMMLNTPIQAIHIIFLTIVILAVRLGLEPFARASELFLPWVMMLFLILVVSLSPQIKFENMLPVMENGIKPVLQAAFPFLSLPFLQLVVFLMILPSINRKDETAKAFVIGTLAGGVVLIAVSFMSILVMGSDYSKSQLFPSYMLAQQINIAGFFQRVEAILAIIWFLTIFFTLTICFYASALGIAQTFRLKSYRFLTLPLGMLTVSLSLIVSPNTSYFHSFLAKIWTPYSLTYGLFLPFLLLAIDLWRKKI
ncbi:endospore germination permease [Paenibacillus sp. LHD-117]|uniref:GerAB/ArcD/ProY family transporter n=1 Tax=Paenibacillus sp. LHD-117 TaxID=3071412 RepID=UPI0027DEEB01|nr:endospore germination permease [Paenibacillus sp. LHD-117]MDQ6420222.1 endospore germination permease [Paenibacillus sp. LHD-117]